MNEASYNPNDPEFLLSRSLDEKLPEADQHRLDDALARSDVLRAEADRLRAVDRLIRRWAARQAEVDYEQLTTTVAQAASAVCEDAELRDVDRLIARWAAREPDVDWERFTAGVVERIESGHATPWHRWVLRLGAPLAAAAVIVLAITASLRQPGPREMVSMVQYERTVEVVSRVSFSRKPTEPAVPEVGRGVGFAAVGVVSEEFWTDESPPF